MELRGDKNEPHLHWGPFVPVPPLPGRTYHDRDCDTFSYGLPKGVCTCRYREA